MMSGLMIYQTLSFARDLTKRVTWSNILQLKLGNIPVPQNALVDKSIWREQYTQYSLLLARNDARICFLGHYPLPHKLTVFLELRFRKTVRFWELVVSADKYSRISLQQMGAVSDNALLRPVADLKLIRDFLKVIQKPYLALIFTKLIYLLRG